MHHFKEIIHFLDYTFAILWGFTVYDLVIAINVGGVFSTIDNIIKLAFAFIGLVYTGVRLHHYYHSSKLDRQIKKEELERITKENDKI
jgi:high-affinity Fe2+/Pb2+ permease